MLAIFYVGDKVTVVAVIVIMLRSMHYFVDQVHVLPHFCFLFLVGKFR